MKQIPAVVCAGGWGQVLRPGSSKLADEIDGRSVIARCIDNILNAGCYWPIIVVVNRFMGNSLMRNIYDAGHRGVHCVYQDQRRGAANAVRCATDLLTMHADEDFAIFFGEMANVKPEIGADMFRLHSETRPDLTFLACPHDASHPLAPQLSRYAYLKQGWSNGHRSADFLGLYCAELAQHGDDILGSVYICRRQWFTRMYPLIPPMDTKKDGYGPEFHLPWLIDLAVRRNFAYQVLRRNVPEQILGINDRSDYEIALKVIKEGAL